MTIQKLSEEVVTKIAAGEVIERPASVVKELVENALDAGATEIKITIEDGGVHLIQVEDNGSGIPSEDLRHACVRHATSKITDVSDLYNIHSLGFRGEALASIAAVSRLSIISRHHTSLEGTHAEYDGENLRSTRHVPRNVGTTVRVERLFEPVPVRLKFLKTRDVENGHIIDVITRYALIHSGKRFTLTIDEKQTINSFGETGKDVVCSIFGTRVAEELLPISDPHVTGYLGKPVISRKDKSQMYLYVNGRTIRDKTLTDAVLAGYDTLLFTGSYPFVILNINVHTQDIDVNIHPQKHEIKFVQERTIFDMVKSCVAATLRAADLTYTSAHTEEFDRLKPSQRQQQPLRPSYFSKEKQHVLATENMHVPTTLQTQKTAKPTTKQYRVIGQFHKTYILVETPEGLLVLDQHAAHERVLYEFLSTKHETVQNQELLQGVVFTVAPKDASLIASAIDILSSWGFVVEESGPNEFLVRTVPVVIGRTLDATTIKEVLLEAPHVGAHSLQDVKKHIIATMACRAAIKAGDVLSEAFITRLVDKLLDLDMHSTCPHGRPTALKMSPYDFEKLFKRKT